MMISSPIWGKLADKYGRRTILMTASVFLFYFGFLTAFAPTFHWVLALRFLVGFFIGGMPQVCEIGRVSPPRGR
jgi:putative MFS transporter